MGLLTRLFAKSPEELMVKGDRFLDSDRFFDARSCYEEALQCRSARELPGDFTEKIYKRIDMANSKLAELNLTEAGYAFSRGDIEKGVDHLELVKELTVDVSILQKAEMILKEYSNSGDDHAKPSTSSSCTSCSHIQVDDSEGSQYDEAALHPLEYFELLIRQLPEDQNRRYADLGEDFAYAYVAAGQDRHHEALALFDKWSGDSNKDIYYCERGKVLHRLGSDVEAEQHLREAIKLNNSNPLARLNLALLLIEADRLEEAMFVLDSMISEALMPEQAALMRGEILESAGNLDEAVRQFSSLLTTEYARTAADKLHGVLLAAGRHSEAAMVFKQYLGKCSH